MITVAKSRAAGHLDRMLGAAGMEERPSYAVGDVARLLGVSRGTVVALCDMWEPEELEGRDLRGMDSYRTQGGHRRIPVGAMVEWLERNNSYWREYGPDVEEE
ncbi:MAG: helix-turn-helix domain-containing protein [Nitrospinota bacterium]|nr:helix-turn-helix domain-containing protein [Nitrospinota bacterium]